MKRAATIALILAALLFLAAVAAAAWYKTAPSALAFAGDGAVPLSQYRTADPTGVPAEMRRLPLAEQGAYLVRAADCTACHTVPGRLPFSGGRAFRLPFGTIYSSNLTPDPEHGIGRWSDAQFIRAVKHGVSSDGTRLYPAMPYASFAAMTDTDVRAIRAYLATLPAAGTAVPADALDFPYNQQRLLPIWNWFMAKESEFRPYPSRSPQWNRGAYLAEALGHCGECHTPRNLGYGLDNRSKFAGSITSGWKAHNISSDRQSGIGGWSNAELAAYLTTGFAAGRGAAGGPMGEAVDQGLRYLTANDIAALIEYLRSVPPIRTAGDALKQTPAPEGFAIGHSGSEGERIFAGNCAGCHDWTGVSPLSPHARLTGIRSVSDPSAANIVQAVLWGVPRRPPDGMTPMPAFGSTLSDREIAQLGNYVSQRFGNANAKLTTKDVARLRSEGGH